MYLESILWLLSMPVVVIVAYQIIKRLCIKNENKFTD
jgi:hypothetical protein